MWQTCCIVCGVVGVKVKSMLHQQDLAGNGIKIKSMEVELVKALRFRGLRGDGEPERFLRDMALRCATKKDLTPAIVGFYLTQAVQQANAGRG